MPMEECLEYLDTDKGKVRAKAYDLVLNGIEALQWFYPYHRTQSFRRECSDFSVLPIRRSKESSASLLTYKYAAPPTAVLV